MDEIKRKILADLIKHSEKPEMSLIVGPRQAGKTTVMRRLEELFIKKGAKTLFLNLDREEDRTHFGSQQSLLAKLGLELGNKQGFVFIDEIQRKENAGLFLKGLYDTKTPYKFVVSGSGSLELKEKIHESMAGRKLLFNLDTVSFREFINFRTDYKYEGKLSDFFKVEAQGLLPRLFSEYINFGGYPRVILSETIDEKTRTIDEIYNSYLVKDLSFLLKVEKIDAIANLFKILSTQIGQLVNYSELCATIGISQATLKNYIYYGEKTFVINRVSPFYRNPRKEIVKSPTMYFLDLGLKNYCAGCFGNLTNHTQMGFVFQNFVYGLLRDSLGFQSHRISFWRSKDKAEVDFVINLGDDLIPIEVKYKKMVRPKVGKSLFSFIKKYRPKTALIVNSNLDETTQVESTHVVFKPYWGLFDFKLR